VANNAQSRFLEGAFAEKKHRRMSMLRTKDMDLASKDNDIIWIDDGSLIFTYGSDCLWECYLRKRQMHFSSCRRPLFLAILSIHVRREGSQRAIEPW
jgi:hypothetical protein